MRATLEERGNGFCDVGDYVAGSDGELYRVTAFRGQIQTGRRPGAANWVLAEVEAADWDDVDDDWESQCGVVVEDEGRDLEEERERESLWTAQEEQRGS